MDYSHPVLLRIRLFLGKKLGLLRPIVGFIRRERGAHYEEGFESALLKSISTNDIVWDIGANIGFYTRKFAELASSGMTVAFEPSPKSFNTLKEAVGSMPNVHLENIALAEQDGEASFFISKNSDEDGLFSGAESSRARISVRTARADSFLLRFPPNIIKVDVEGFELEVLRGMSEILKQPHLKYIYIEVHFSVLSYRGQADAPTQIVSLLKGAGMFVKWLDPSHLVASRSSGLSN
jgi:FkbM family methyltransferase